MSDPCCPSLSGHDHSDHEKRSFDIILYGTLFIICMSVVAYPLMPQNEYLYTFVYAVMGLLRTMWWGVALGLLFVGFMTKIPREYFTAVLGRGDSFGGLVRATVAGLFLDLCSHGILLVGAKLYERGVSLAQVMAFLIASPWNSFSLTIILISLIGLKWTLIYTLCSAVIALITGVVYQKLIRRGVFPDNPYTADKLEEGFSLSNDMSSRLKNFSFSAQFFKDIFLGGLGEARMLLRWLLLGVVIAAAMRSFMPVEFFEYWLGPTFLGLLMTLGLTTIIEVCSEGSAPIANEIFHRGKAPGNGFAFLMAGVSTDYTEMMIIKEFSKSWWIALSLPLITVPQILILGYIMNVVP